MTLGLLDLAFLGQLSKASAVNGITSNAGSTVNPFGQWSYIRKTSINSSSATLLSYSGTPGSWQGPEGFNLPLLAIGQTIFMHPGTTSTTVAIRWTSPVETMVTISATFVKDTTTGASNGVLVGITKNNTVNVTEPILIDASSPTAVIANASVSVAAGDAIDFYVNTNGSSASDHTNCTLLEITY